MQDLATPVTGGFDVDTWREELLKLNPWARDLALDEKNGEFIAARQKATLARHAEGEAAWNAWANGMLGQKAALESAGHWAARREVSDKPLVGENNVTRTWLRLASAVFSTQTTRHHFNADVSFAEFLFPGDACFKGASFGYARFDGAGFCGDAEFGGGASFSDGAQFGLASFGGYAVFAFASFGGSTSFDSARFAGDAMFVSAIFGGRHTQFDDARFAGDALFNGTSFAGDAWFARASIAGKANFYRATFGREARFRDASFGGDAHFGGTSFRGDALFRDASFSGRTFLNNVRFNAPAIFAQTKFREPATFADSVFQEGADFEGVDSASAFSLADTTYRQVPNFFGATFKGVLRLDNVKTPPYRLLGYTLDKDATARFRDLRRRAVEAQDRDRELEFFAQEIRTGRFHAKGLPSWVPKVWSWRFWFGLAFEAFSDFGRSLWRPLLSWLVLAALFAVLFLGEHEDMHEARAGIAPSGPLSTIAAYAATTRDAWAKPPGCRIEGREPFASTNAVTEAIQLSLRNALVFDIGRADSARRTYGCLFGLEKDGDQQYLRVSARVSTASTIQALASGLLIFLFLLAVRHLLRLK